MNYNKIKLAEKIILSQERLIDSFDTWVRLIKSKDIESASKIVKESNLLRKRIFELKKEYKLLKTPVNYDKN